MRYGTAIVVLMGLGVLGIALWAPLPEGRVRAWREGVRARLRPSIVEDRYRLAERYYQAGDFEKCELECERALRINPHHAPTKALFTEVSFILGKGKATPATQNYDRIMTGCIVTHQQVLVEIDHALARAERHRVAGDRDAALREVRKVFEFAKWMPEGIELNDRRHKAECLKILLASGP